ncbi:MAG: phosphoribosyltransferase family protein [Candidatus Curtissbacteria bacterium]|nr:phosphoribosyltransferase family protein [Candidatus Curtissbacteria bacterium]
MGDYIFENREQAGKFLATEIGKLKLAPKKSIIAAIARGGVVVGQEVAKALKIPLKVLVIKKIGAPQNPELAIGAVSASGKSFLDYWFIRDLKVSQSFLKKEINKKRKEAQERENLLGIELKEADFRGKTAIIVDDGLATGASARAAAKVVRDFGTDKIILALPCGFPKELGKIKDDFDKVICLRASADFWAVGQFYRDFRPIEDEDVKTILNSKN